MAIIMGMDLGNGNIKGVTGNKRFFIPSTLIEGTSKLDDTSINIEYKDKNLILGKMQGDRKRDYAKYSTEHHEAMLMASVACLIDDNSEVEVTDIIPVVGLPIKYFLGHGKEYRDIVLSITNNEPATVKVNGKLRKIKIKDCIVLPQGALPFKDNSLEGYTLVIDIGSGTVDASYWDRRTLIKAETYNIGCLDLYSNIASRINELDARYNMEPFLIERQLVKNPNLEEIKILGAKVNVKHIVESEKKAFTESIVSKISQDFSNFSMIDDICVVGGGAIYVQNPIKNTAYEYATIITDVFFNAAIYYKIGVNTFGNSKN